MEEIWKAVVGYEGLYEVSDDGRVKSFLKYKDGLILKNILSSNGYYVVSLNNKGKAKVFCIHKLMALSFLENPKECPCINHKDGIKLHNTVENIEWCTYSENNFHAYKNNLNSNQRPVVSYTIHMEKVKEYQSARSAEKDGYQNQLISKCCRNKRKTHGNLIWKYL